MCLDITKTGLFYSKYYVLVNIGLFIEVTTKTYMEGFNGGIDNVPKENGPTDNPNKKVDKFFVTSAQMGIAALAGLAVVGVEKTFGPDNPGSDLLNTEQIQIENQGELEQKVRADFSAYMNENHSRYGDHKIEISRIGEKKEINEVTVITVTLAIDGEDYTGVYDLRRDFAKSFELHLKQIMTDL